MFLAGLHFVSEKNKDKISSTMNATKRNTSISAKKIQGNVLLLNGKAHAKIQALLKEKKIHSKKSLRSVLH